MTVTRRLALSLGRGRSGRLAVRLVSPFAGGHRLVVLTYHRVATDRSAVTSMAPGLVSALAADLRDQLRYIGSRFRLIDLDELVSLLDGRPTDGRKPPLMITFDDAYRDTLEVAWPLLRAAGAPATMFVPTAYPDGATAFWWDQLAFSVRTSAATEMTWGSRRLPLATAADRLAAMRLIHRDVAPLPTDETIRAVERLAAQLDTGPAPVEVLGWSEIRAMAAEGLAIGGHSHSHHRMDLMPPADLRDDLQTSRSILAEQLGRAPRAFAYPGGHHTDAAAAAVEAAGFEVAFTTRRAVADARRPDRYRLPRLNVGLSSDAALLALQAMVLPPTRARPPARPGHD